MRLRRRDKCLTVCRAGLTWIPTASYAPNRILAHRRIVIQPAKSSALEIRAALAWLDSVSLARSARKDRYTTLLMRSATGTEFTFGAV